MRCGMFTSPDTKAQVRFSDHSLSVVPRRRRCRRHRHRWRCRKLFTFSSSSPEPNQTWHKASLGDGHLSLFK